MALRRFSNLFVRLFLLPALLVVVSAYFYASAEIENELTRLRSEEHLNVGLGAVTLSGTLDLISRDLVFLSSHSALREAVNDPAPQRLAHLADDFANFSRSKGIYDQLRWIDETGMERVRIDFAVGQPHIVAPGALQNKGKRYFFVEAMKLNPGEIFVSPLDLNVEQGKIELPYKPMIRVATPIVDRTGVKRGIVIINYYGSEMLQAFAGATLQAADHIMLTNGEGYWLKSPNRDDEWGFMFRRDDLTLAVAAPTAWRHVRNEDAGQLALADGLWTWETVFPLLAGQKSGTGAAAAFVASRGEMETRQYAWKVVAHQSAAALAAIRHSVWLKLALVATLALSLLGLGSAKLAHAWALQADSEDDLRIAAGAFDAQEGMMVTDASLVILRVNHAFTEITGYSALEAVGQSPRLLASGRNSEAFYAAMWESIGHTGSWRGEIWNRRKNGESFPAWLSISALKGDDGRVTHYVASFTDIAERKAAAEQIEHLAFYDPLTELPNRRLMLDRLRQALISSSRRHRQGALMLIDLDNFKMLNDTQGHDVGDQLLIEVAARLGSGLRESDTVARLGGDEFVVILDDLEPSELAASQVENVAEKILARLGETYVLKLPLGDGGSNTCAHHCTSSIGVTLFDDSATVDELMKRADTAMYQAKAAGRNTLRFFDPAMQAAVSERAALEVDLRKAIVDGQFFLHYQPQVDAAGRVTGAEALLRWHHPSRGIVAPGEFIPLAEESGLILPIGHWVLETACARLAAWAKIPELAELSLAVNVSARQFSLPGIAEEIFALLDHFALPAEKLKLELTESLLLENAEDVIAKMLLLKTRGVSFSLDDFGTGYSSLSYLKRLPLEQLKIDRSFVRDVLTDANDAAIARTIVALARSLGLTVIAEGVETQAQRDFLADNGCLAYQGYLFSRPLSADAFADFVTRR